MSERIANSGERTTPKWLPKILGVAATAALALGGCSSHESPTPEPTATATATATESAQGCAPEHTQAAEDHVNNVVDSDFGEAIQQIVESNPENLSQALIKEVLAQAGTNAYLLEGLRTGITGVEHIAATEMVTDDGTCLNETGQKALEELADLYEGAQARLETAPRDARNSGVHNGIFGVATEAGINGDEEDLKAVYITVGDGVSIVLCRCGNTAFPPSYKHNLPEVLTDNQFYDTTPIVESGSNNGGGNGGGSNEGYAPKSGPQISGGEGSYSNGTTGNAPAENSAPSGPTTRDQSGNSYQAPAADPNVAPGSPSRTQSGGTQPGTGSSGVKNPEQSTTIDQGGGAPLGNTQPEQQYQPPVEGDVDPDD